MKPVLCLPLVGLTILTAVSCFGDPTGLGSLPALITELPRSLSQAELALIEADNAFALKLFREIEAHESASANIFVSPLSVSMALGMTYNGAAGETQEAMAQTLEFQELSLDDVNQGYRDLIDLLFDLDPQIEWQLANSIWYREGFFVEPSFIDVNRIFFDAQVEALDFGGPSAADVMNQWVSDGTNGRIEEIVDNPIDPNTIMFLINAISFKGDWRHQFDKDLTRDAPFTLLDGTQITTPRMAHRHEVEVRMGWDALASVVEMPYGGDAFTMVVVLPHPGVSLQSVVDGLDSEQWAWWMTNLSEVEVVVEMPKFSFEYEIGLKDVLTSLGMGIAFDDSSADFTKINPAGDLHISTVKHKTFVQVDEEGTEAAAATSVEVGVTSAPLPFVIDRPFLFAIRERITGTILFMGKMVDPR
jgi:serpin B